MTQFSSSVSSIDTMAIVDDAALVRCYDTKSSSHREELQVSNDNQTDDHSKDDDTMMMMETSTTPQLKKTKSVVFAEADVVEFEPTVWTATIASDGVPVGLSSTVRRRARRRLDSFEGERLLHRINRQEYMEHGYLEPDERMDMLEAAGHSVAIINHVERETVRLNRERWESNEYDLLYQFGLGETAVMDLDDDQELLLSQGTIMGSSYYNTDNQQEPADELDDDEMLEAQDDDEEDDDSGNPAEYYYYSNCNTSTATTSASPTPTATSPRTQAQADADVRFAMEEIDAYDTRKYEEWAWDYTTDCILGDDNDQYDKAFDLPSLDFGLPEMSSSPTDVATSSECMIVSCGKVIGVGSSSSSPSKVSKASKASTPGLFV